MYIYMVCLCLYTHSHIHPLTYTPTYIYTHSCTLIHTHYVITGWRKDVVIRLSGHKQGTLDTLYLPPGGNRRYRTKGELTAYVLANNNGLSSASSARNQLSLFDYRSVYCVCHQPPGIMSVYEWVCECRLYLLIYLFTTTTAMLHDS